MLKLINEFSKDAGEKVNIQLHFYTITTKHLKKKWRKLSIHDSIKNNKILRDKFIQGCERSVQWKLQDSDERNWSRLKQMERYLCGPELVLLKYPC